MPEHKFKYTATLPDGTTVKRTSARNYTHIVAIKQIDGSWGSVGFCGTYWLAAKLAAKYRGYTIVDDAGQSKFVNIDTEIIPVEVQS